MYICVCIFVYIYTYVYIYNFHTHTHKISTSACYSYNHIHQIHQNQQLKVTQSSGIQKSKIDFIGVNMRCQLGCIPSGSSRGEFLPCSFQHLEGQPALPALWPHHCYTSVSIITVPNNAPGLNCHFSAWQLVPQCSPYQLVAFAPRITFPLPSSILHTSPKTATSTGINSYFQKNPN